MFKKKAISVALDNGKDVVQLVRQGERQVPVGIGLVICLTVFPTPWLKRRSHFFIR